MMDAVVIAGAVLLTAVIFVFVLRGIARTVAAAGRAEIAKRYSAEEIVLAEPSVNSFGLESKGALQLRGNGGLVLTAKDLHFLMLVPRREIRIPLADIREVKTVRSHLGKTVVRPLLHVRWGAGETEEAIAWWVRDVDAWKARLASCTAMAP